MGSPDRENNSRPGWLYDITNPDHREIVLHKLYEGLMAGINVLEPWGLSVVIARKGNQQDAAETTDLIGRAKRGRVMWLPQATIEQGRTAKPAVTIAPLDNIWEIVDLEAMVKAREITQNRITEEQLKRYLYGLLGTGLYTELLLKPEFAEHLTNWLPKEIPIDGEKKYVASMLVTCLDNTYPHLAEIAKKVWDSGHLLMASSANISGQKTLVGEPEPVWELVRSVSPNGVVLDNPAYRKLRENLYPELTPASGTIIFTTTHPLIKHEEKDHFMVVIGRQGNLGLPAVADRLAPLFAGDAEVTNQIILQYLSDAALLKMGKVLIWPKEQFNGTKIRELNPQILQSLGFE